MNQNGTPTLDPEQPDTQETVDSRNVRMIKFTRARIFLFISFPILILLFSTNTIVLSVITTMLILLSIGNIFDPISSVILEYTDKLLILLGKPFKRIWRLLFAKHRLFLSFAAILALITLLRMTTLSPWFGMVFNNLNDSVCLNTHLPWPACSSGLGVSALPSGVRIGLIAGNTSDSPFDRSTLNSGEKQVEDLIFKENSQACAGQHVTLVVVTMLSRIIEDPLSTADHSVEGLQGSYLAQHDYNTKHAIKICLAVVNLGTVDNANEDSPLVKSNHENYSITPIIHQIAQFAHNDRSFRGIVGFRYSQQAEEALQIVQNYQNLSQIPIVSPSASSDDLSNKPNFYRIVSPDHSQGTALAQFFCNTLRKEGESSDSIAMLTDRTDTYSRSLQLAFSDAINKCSGPVQGAPIDYKNGDANSIRQAVGQALQRPGVRYILFPGYDKDMDTVELKTHEVLKDHASDITIIGGDGINNVDATTHYAYNHVYAITFNGPLPEKSSIVTSFSGNGFSIPPFVSPIPAHKWIPANTLLGYDSVNAFAQTVNQFQSGDFTQEDFNKSLATIQFNGTNDDNVAFQGTRGNGHVSDRNQGYLYITCNDYGRNTHLITKYITNNVDSGSVQNLPLGPADGTTPCS